MRLSEPEKAPLREALDDVDLWFRMRDLRNRIAGDHLPEQLREIHRLIRTEYGPELMQLAVRLGSA